MKTFKTFLLPLFLLFTTLLAACGGGGGDSPAAATYSVVYSANGSTGGSVPSDAKAYTASSTATVLGNTGALVKTGSLFTGWNTAADGSGTAYAAGASLAIGSANITLYAAWAPTYSVHYDGNGYTGGTAPVDATAYAAGASATVLGNTGTLVKAAGYVFTGWNTAVDGSGTAYAAGASLAITSADITLYAVWAPPHSVSYNGNGYTGGTAPVDATAYAAGARATVLGNTGALVKAVAYAFTGWNTAADGSGTAYAVGASLVVASADITLYAMWAPPHTVSYNGNGNTGGTSPTDTTPYAAGASATVLDNTGTLVRAGYVFTRWNTAADGNGTAYAPGASITMGSAGVTLYAVWTPTYTVSYNGNGNTGGTAPVDATAYMAGTSTTVLGNSGALVKTGYAFAGWNKKADGSGTAYAAGANLSVISTTGNATLYAAWTLQRFAQVTTLAGSLAHNSGSTDGTGTAARFSSPFGVTTDGTSLYVADTYNNTIRKVVLATGVVTTLAGTANSGGNVDGTGAAARFRSPEGITSDGTNLYVVDDVYSTIRKIVIATGVVTTLAGPSAGGSGFQDGTGAAARFGHPYGITNDGTNLYVADKDNHTIRKVVIATAVVTTLAGTAGSGGSVDGTGAAARFLNPLGIATDGTHLYVADTVNNTIRKIVIATGEVTTLAGIAGTVGSTDGTGTAATFNLPYALIIEGGSLYVTDTRNNTIRKVVIATGEVTTLAGIAGTNGSTDGAGAAALFSGPRGITTDGTNLYVTDSNNTIRKLQ